MRKIRFIDSISNEKANLKDLKEASFRSGQVEKMLPKIASILSRRTGTKTVFSIQAIGYENEYGKFAGYKGYFGNTPIRMNVRLSTSDQLESIDIYENSRSMIPTKRVEFEGHNIVQVMDLLADSLTGEILKYKENFEMDSSKKLSERFKLEERVTLQDMMVEWLQENPGYVQDIKRDSFNFEDPTIRNEFISFIQNNYRSGKREINSGSFKYNIRKAIENTPALSSMVNANHVPSVSVKTGVPDKKHLILDPAARAAYEEAHSNNAVADIFNTIEEKTREIAQGFKYSVGMLLYGRPGTGKTFTVERILKEEGADYISIGGGIDGSDALLRILYENSEDKVIVFDDNDSVFGSKKSINILKQALQTRPVRQLGFGTPVKFGRGELVIPPEFEFTSKIIFISNLTEIDSALKSRLTGKYFALNFSLEEMYSLVKSRLHGILSHDPDITDEMRDEVFDFLKELIPVAADLDFRVFEACLVERVTSEQAGNDLWKVRSVQIIEAV